MSRSGLVESILVIIIAALLAAMMIEHRQVKIRTAKCHNQTCSMRVK